MVAAGVRLPGARRNHLGMPALFESINLSSIGLALDIVGVIFLTNALVVRKPRRFIQQYFGIERTQPLRTVLDQLNAKAQIATGFVALLIGFSLQIAASFQPPAGIVAPQIEAWPRVQGLLVLAFGILLVTMTLRLVQNAWSLGVMRKLLSEFFREHRDWNFEKHPNKTREIGELLGVPSLEDDSIGDYADRVRARLKLTGDPRDSRTGDDAFAPVRNVGARRR